MDLIRLGLDRAAVERAEEKATAPSNGMVTLQLGRQPAQWRGTDPKRLLKDGLSANVTVYGCVMGWARAFSSLQWYLVRKPRAGSGAKVKKLVTFEFAAKAYGTQLGRKSVQQAEIEDHSVLRLKEHPNPMMKGSEYDEAFAAYLMSTGNSYQEFVRSGNSINGRIIELWTLMPQTMKVVPGVRVPLGYSLDPGGGKQPIPYDLWEIDHMRLFSGLDPWYGMSPLSVAARAVDSDNEAVRWQYEMLRNDMRPTGAFVSKTGLSDASYLRLKKQMRESHQGGENARKPLVLDNGLEWVTFSLTPGEVDWVNSRNSWFEDICTAYNYAKELLAKGGQVTYANRKEAKKAHYSENILPLADKVRDIWNTRIVPTHGDNLYLDYDRDQIEALQEDQEKLWARVDASRELTLNEKREAKGYPTHPSGDVILVSSGDVPLELALEPQSEVVDGEVVGGGGRKPKGALPAGEPGGETEKALARLRGLVDKIPSAV